jgi:putative molybdopterin biosynthesis protein
MAQRELFQQIAEHFRQLIFRGEMEPGDRLPAIRDLSQQWSCTPGTVQRAYKQLAEEGLVSSRHGQGTRVVAQLPTSQSPTIRSVNLVHNAESFLLESFTLGYNMDEIETAMQVALDRWKQASTTGKESKKEEKIIHFNGSHDPGLIWLVVNFDEIHPAFPLKMTFTGSLGGLIALSENRADIAGCHLFDVASKSYNDPFIKKILPQGAVAITLTQRRIGWITAAGNPKGFRDIGDLSRKDITFINRQSGSGTRVLLDSMLEAQQIDQASIQGYGNVVWTHSEAAQHVAESKADVAFGLEAAAQTFHLDFQFITLEQYDLVMKNDYEANEGLQVFINYIQSPAAKNRINKLVGYDTSMTGKMRKIGVYQTCSK